MELLAAICLRFVGVQALAVVAKATNCLRESSKGWAPTIDKILAKAIEGAFWMKAVQ